MLSFFRRLFGTAQDRTISRLKKMVAEIRTIEEGYQKLSDEDIRGKTAEFKERLQKGETTDDILKEAYAAVVNVCRRMLGNEFHVSGYHQRWDMIPFDVQIAGAIALHQGYITEMQTGEGKTLTAAMPLYLNALTGRPVHIVTVNDYLANRDCEWVGSIYRWLGLTTGVLMQATPYHERKAVYECDIVYGTASEFGFDYLRDNSVATHATEQVQRGHYFSLIDEVDSILIDEARTPLIISGPAASTKQLYEVLKDPVRTLVDKQREACNVIALDAKRVLDKHLKDSPNVQEKKKWNDQEKEALRKLWLVGKGMPRNKVVKRLKEDPSLRAAIDEWDLYYYAEQNKEEKAEALAGLYMIVDEKSSEYELTDKGIHCWAECGGKEDDFVMLDLGYEYLQIDQNFALSEEEKMKQKVAVREEDAIRKERAHNLRQLLRAHLLMEKDVDYIVQEQKVVIIDENTGRPQPGRRFSDGLHQAIEAKEMVAIQRETQTYATITIQNYFRMYERLAGMTGTAITEAHEFKEIYKLDVVQVPTHRPLRRSDANDEMYMTEREKYNAILKEVRDTHAQGRPILLGTESVEVSEKLSRIFKLNKLEHTVLNAKNHSKEAEIISLAGQRGAITVATNMAGRGTDIKLGEGVAALGGLHVVGTTRHQSRRIDRQLRGRSGRLGDPGSSKFFVSLEDPLMRLFSSPGITQLLQRFRPPEGEPISAKILNKSIETAQKRIEQRNYMVRKHTLEYDDVMNKQRQEIYAFRHELLNSPDVTGLAEEVLENLCLRGAERYFRSKSQDGGWEPEQFRQWLMAHVPVTFEEGYFDDDFSEAEELGKKAYEKVKEAFQHKLAHEAKKAALLSRRADFDASGIMDAAERGIMVRTIDHFWQEHLLSMDHLRSDVHLRSVAQKDPIMEFKHEAFILFEKFTQQLREEMAQAIFKFEIVPAQPPEMGQFLNQLHLETRRSFASELEEEDAETLDGEAMGAAEVEAPVEPIMVGPKVGRNDLCPCGSGKKYKKCCGRDMADADMSDIA